MAVLTGPNKLMCKSSRGLEVETTFFALKCIFESPYDMPYKEHLKQTLDLEGL